MPSFAKDLNPDIVQIHSLDYRNPGQLRPGGVLIAGGGNSGAEIGLEVGRQHERWLAGRDTGHLPFQIDGLAGRLLLVRIVLRGIFHRVLTVSSPIGRKARAHVLHRGGPLIRTKPYQLQAAGIARVPRMIGVRNGLPLLEGGAEMPVANVIWCTGFTPGFSWIDLPIFGADGDPEHASGIVSSHPGLYFVGLHFLHAMSSGMIHGVGRDASRIAKAVAGRNRARQHAVRQTAA